MKLDSSFSNKYVLLAMLAAMPACSGGQHPSEQAPPNVLLIVVDDLNDWVGCLDGHPDTRTPNIDRLAERGVLFTNAHCQAPICNPSRTSTLFGLRPSTTGFYNNKVFSASSESFTSKHLSMPRAFAINGYKTFTTGKIYHNSELPPGDFEVVGPRPGFRNDLDQVIQTDRPDELSPLWDFGPQNYAEEKFNDYVDASWAIDQLKEKHNRPFFMALGFYRPHVPFFSPVRIYNSPDLLDGFGLPIVKDDDWSDLSTTAYDLTMTRTHLPRHSWMQGDNNARWKQAVQAYLACIRWTDEQLGRVLDTLDASPYADNTIIVFYSDHGFHLGEKLRWSKVSLWERSTRVPLIISIPKGSKGQRCERPVELLNLYPTLVELCRLKGTPDLEGKSMKLLLANPQSEWDHPAITTLLQNNHAVRTQRWRYIRYADGSEELYDHEKDPNEWTNLAAKPESNEVIARLKKYVPKVNVEQTPGDEIKDKQ